MHEFDAWRKANTVIEGGPREFPDAADHIPGLLRSSKAFRRSWARHGEDFSDKRVKFLVVIAPGPPVRSFAGPSIARLDLPVSVLPGGASTEALPEHCADWLGQQNSSFRRQELGSDVGHDRFLEYPADKSLVGKVEIFTDHENVDRRKVHDGATQIALKTMRIPARSGARQQPPSHG